MTQSRWVMLAALFFARAGMGFQYQTVASSIASLRSESGLSLNEVGVLVGAYFLFGIVVALPGGALCARIGGRRGALIGLALMTAGGVWQALTTGWIDQLGARIVAGIGGVLVNIMMAKLVNDWFADSKIATAMGLFVSSWTFGVAIALVAVPWIEHSYHLSGVYLAAAVWAGLGFAVVAALVRERGAAPSASAASANAVAAPAFPLASVVLAGMVWGWFNAAFATIFSFGPATLMADGLTSGVAGFQVSLVLWISLLSVPLGGVLSDRWRQPDLMILICPAIVAILILATPSGNALVATFLCIGLIIGLPAGPIMALPPQVLAPQHRALGMGIFFTVFYVIMSAAPVAAGYLATAFDTPRMGYRSGALWIFLGLLSFALFAHTRRTVQTGRIAAGARSA